MSSSTIDLSAGWVSSMVPKLFSFGVDHGNSETKVPGLLVGAAQAAGSAAYAHASIRLMKGDVPASFAEIPVHTSRSSDVLVQFATFNAIPANNDLSPAQTGVNPAIITTTYRPASISGTATWFWWIVSDRVTSPSTYHNIYGTVGPVGSGADLEMPDTNIVAGEQYRILNFQLRFPTTWVYPPPLSVNSILISAYANAPFSPTGGQQWNPVATGEPTWSSYFGNTTALGAFVWGASEVTLTGPRTIPYFQLNDILEFDAYNSGYVGDKCDSIIQFQNAAGVTKFYMQTDSITNFNVRLRYGVGTPTNIATGVGLYAQVNGKLSFSGSGVTFTRNPGLVDNYVDNFTLATDISDVTKIVVSGLYSKCGVISVASYARVLLRIST